MEEETVKITLRVAKSMNNDMDKLAVQLGVSKNNMLINAFKLLQDYTYSNKKMSFLNDQIIAAMQGITDRMEMRLNHKTNQVLSELAIQVSIMEQILGNSLEVDGSVLSKFRQNAVEFLKTNQRILRMDEVIE